jgi:RNA polymerase sigma-70 factor (ECF subfamily)
MDENDLARVLKRCLVDGQRADWDVFVALAQPLVAAGVLRSLSRLALATRELVDDLIQETFLKLCSNDFRILRNFRAGDTNALCVYLKTIASSIVMDHFRLQTALKKGASKITVSLDDVAAQLAVNDGQFAAFELRTILRHVETCLATQDPRNRAIFWLYHRLGMTPKEIASVPGVELNIDGIETAVYRLTKSVRECLRRAGLLQKEPIHEGDHG